MDRGGSGDNTGDYVTDIVGAGEGISMWIAIVIIWLLCGWLIFRDLIVGDGVRSEEDGEL